VSAAKSKGKMRVVVDGSNLATEGRSTPSLPQLRDAVASFLVEYPGAEMLVVVDATFGHRIVSSEQVAFKELEAAGDMVSPPAGSVGRGDAFILKIAERIGGVVLSNDSFQEFQIDHPWLFEEDRLIGGKPVPRVGWIFTPRVPVKGAARPAPVKKLAIVLPDGKKPTIGTTLTPKAAKAAPKAPKAAAPKVTKKAEATEPAAKGPAKKAPAKAVPAPLKIALPPVTPATSETPETPESEPDYSAQLENGWIKIQTDDGEGWHDPTDNIVYDLSGDEPIGMYDVVMKSFVANE
jgi:hypothetical protein